MGTTSATIGERRLNPDRRMTAVVKHEAGYDQALEGLSYNKNQLPENMDRVIKYLAPKDYGHNKSLEAIYLWVSVRGTRKFWVEADTYRVGTSKQSQSTVHCILKRPLVQEDFSTVIPPAWIDYLNKLREDRNFVRLTDLLPHAYLQKRMWVFNYKFLRNMIIQREKHPLVEWQIFLSSVLKQIKHPELLPGNVEWMEKQIVEKLEKETF